MPKLRENGVKSNVGNLLEQKKIFLKETEKLLKLYNDVGGCGVLKAGIERKLYVISWELETYFELIGKITAPVSGSSEEWDFCKQYLVYWLNPDTLEKGENCFRLKSEALAFLKMPGARARFPGFSEREKAPENFVHRFEKRTRIYYLAWRSPETEGVGVSFA